MPTRSGTDGTAPGMEFMDWGRVADGGGDADVTINDIEIDVT